MTVDYLRRLLPHPARRVGAARLDLPPHFAPRPDLVQPAQWPEPAPPAHAPERAAVVAGLKPVDPQQKTQPYAAPHTAERLDEPVLDRPVEERRSEPERATAVRNADVRADTPPVHVAPVREAIDRPLHRALAPQRPSRGDDHAVARVPDAAPAAPSPHRKSAWAATPRAATLDPAIRIETLREHARDAQPSPTVVHVTIDRIDVRLPPTAPAPATPRRQRPSSNVAPLGAYLRGGMNGDNSGGAA